MPSSGTESIWGSVTNSITVASSYMLSAWRLAATTSLATAIACNAQSLNTSIHHSTRFVPFRWTLLRCRKASFGQMQAEVADLVEVRGTRRCLCKVSIEFGPSVTMPLAAGIPAVRKIHQITQGIKRGEEGCQRKSIDGSYGAGLQFCELH